LEKLLLIAPIKWKKIERVVIRIFKGDYVDRIRGVSKNSSDEVEGVNLNSFDWSLEGFSIGFVVRIRALERNSFDHVVVVESNSYDMIEAVIFNYSALIEGHFKTLLNASEELVITPLMCNHVFRGIRLKYFSVLKTRALLGPNKSPYIFTKFKGPLLES
jgi:hypothetical protein